MPSDTIQWFPGHMAKTRRLIEENLRSVDIVIEILDARIPYSSENPEIRRLIGTKPSLTILNKASLASSATTAAWIDAFRKNGKVALAVDCKSGEGFSRIAPTVREILSEKLERYENKGMTGRKLRAMIVGIPNVGKSSIINRLSGAKKAKVENRPGVTLDKQWIPTTIGLDLMDMPGILWPKFEERRVGENLALTGAIRDAILNTEELAVILCRRLRTLAPDLLSARYKLDQSAIAELDDYDLFLTIGKKRGLVISGGEIDTERTATMLLDEFRDCKIGRISLETPEEKDR